jgi:hypothetical protein
MPMTDYRPLSKIGLYDPALDTSMRPLEPWMRAAALEWLDQFLLGDHGPRRDFIRSLEMTHRLQRIPAEPADAAYAIRNLVANDPVFGMDAIAFGLSRLGRSNPDLALVQEMMKLLRQGGHGRSRRSARTDRLLATHPGPDPRAAGAARLRAGGRTLRDRAVLSDAGRTRRATEPRSPGHHQPRAGRRALGPSAQLFRARRPSRDRASDSCW